MTVLNPLFLFLIKQYCFVVHFGAFHSAFICKCPALFQRSGQTVTWRSRWDTGVSGGLLRSIHYSDGGIWLAAAGACVCTPVAVGLSVCLSLFRTASSSERPAPGKVNYFLIIRYLGVCLFEWNWSEISSVLPSCLQLRVWKVKVLCHITEQKPKLVNNECVCFHKRQLKCVLWRCSYSNR